MTVDERTRDALDGSTRRFYRCCADSFSQTRQIPWRGWSEVVRALEQLALERQRPLSILDVGCGNLRFERFLLERGVPFSALCLDRCEALVQAGLESDRRLSGCCRFCAFDISPSSLEGLPGLGSFSTVVAFGLLHHIPGRCERAALLKAMGRCLEPGGLMAVSLWDVDSDERLSRKAPDDTKAAKELLGLGSLDPGDYVLGWQSCGGTFRYCHSFSDAEADELEAEIASEFALRSRYRADGPSDRSNIYMLFDKRQTRVPVDGLPL